MRRSLTASVIMLLCAARALAAPADDAEARQTAREIYATLIGMDTSVEGRRVPAAAAYLAGRFHEAGFPAADVHVLPLGDTAALVVRYRGDGSGGRPIALLAHLDVVTAHRSDWQRDPFRLTEEGGYFYGRGTEDVKSEVALIATTLLRLHAAGWVPTRDLIMAFTGDEESTQQTTRDLVTVHRELIDAEFALNGDGGGGTLDESSGRPLVYYVQGAEKNYASFDLTAHNAGGHSSEPRADNAIYELADALELLRRHVFPVMWNDWTLGDFRAAGAATPGPLGKAMARFAANPRDAAAAAVIAREPQRVGKTRTTCVATMLAGGHADNALPQSATATVNCRIFPGTPIAAVQATLQALVGPRIAVTLYGEPSISDASPMRADVMAASRHAVAVAHPGAAVVPDMAAYATDGAVFRSAGIPTYGVGSTFEKDSDSFAHGLDERLQVKEFYAGLAHWDVLIHDLAGAATHRVSRAAAR